MSGVDTSPKVVLVSGANRGIGEAIAHACIDAGYIVSLGARQTQELLVKFGRESSTKIYNTYDAMDETTTDGWVKRTLTEFNRIDALVNNAACAEPTSLTSDFSTAFDRMMAVNVKAPWLLTQKCLPHLEAGGTGRVIFMSSVLGKRVMKDENLAYAMTKSCIVQLNEVVRQTTWDKGVRSTVICPGWVNTDMAGRCTSLTSLQMIQPEHVAHLVVTAIQLPNNASVAEISVNCQVEHVA